jgi:hypothetical protein
MRNQLVPAMSASFDQIIECRLPRLAGKKCDRNRCRRDRGEAVPVSCNGATFIVGNPVVDAGCCRQAMREQLIIGILQSNDYFVRLEAKLTFSFVS